MKVLITGGAGFIGSHVVDLYINNGYDVVVVDNLFSGNFENINPKAKFYLLDIRSPLLENIFTIEKPQIVNHLAAQISIQESIKDPKFDLEMNIIGLLNVLENSVKNNVKKIIFGSSGGAIYGEADEYPTTENSIPNPLNPYAITKYASENYLCYYKNQFSLDYTILRYSNVYGPRQISFGEAGVVSIFIEKLLNNEIPIIHVYPDRPEGMIRDYLYVKDVAEANLYALQKGDCQILNISSNIGTTTSELFNEICKIMNKKVTPCNAGPRHGDLKRSCLDNFKAKNILNWSPSTSLYDGLEETYEYFKIMYKKTD